MVRTGLIFLCVQGEKSCVHTQYASLSISLSYVIGTTSQAESSLIGLQATQTKYTLEKYKAIVKWKTAFYSFYLPVAIAMYMVSYVIGTTLQAESSLIGLQATQTKYTLEKYKAIVKWKTAFYSFYLPVAIAMYMVSYVIGTTSQAESSLIGLQATQTKYTLEKYKAIVKWKTAFYSFYLPVAIAMYMVSYVIGTTSQAESSLIGLQATQTKYTLEKYKAIVKWKTAFYSFYLPVAIAMYMVSYVIGTTSQAESSLIGLQATQTKYTLEKYKAIVKWKTAFYSFYLPVAIAMYMVSYVIGTTSQAESSLIGLQATQTKYTLEKYKAIVKWKTAFYSFYLPVAIAMYMVSYVIGTTSQAESSLIGLQTTQIKCNYML